MHLESTISPPGQLMVEYEVFLKFGTWEYSVATKKIAWSVGMYKLFGYDPVLHSDVEINEALYKQHIDPADYEKGVTLKNDTTSNKGEYFWQYRITTLQGDTKWLETYGHILRDEQGNFVKTVGLTRDITRLKSYEHGLEMKIRELNRSNAELEEFAYVASHDMQEPLRKLLTFSERLTTKYSHVLQQEGQLYVSRMAAAANNMRLLIDNLLDFSRISRTGDPFESVALDQVLRKALADMEVSIEDTKAVVTADPLPVIEAQAEQMKQLFLNIISNAIKFRKASDAPAIHIRSSVLPVKDLVAQGLDMNQKYFCITIADNGIGFEQEYAEKIFQIFQRLHGKAEYAGSGIGLAICKKIVDYHRGLIFAKGEPGHGATISIILPETQ